MTVESVRERLHNYIEQADEKKLNAIYIILESEIDSRSDIYDERTLNGFRATSDAYFSGKMSSYSMEESLQRIRQQIAQK